MPCSRAASIRFSLGAQVAVEQRLVAEVADPAAQLPGLARAARRRARSPRRPSGAAGRRGCAAAWSCPTRSGRARPACCPPSSSQVDARERGPLAEVAASAPGARSQARSRVRIYPANLPRGAYHPARCGRCSGDSGCGARAWASARHASASAPTVTDPGSGALTSDDGAGGSGSIPVGTPTRGALIFGVQLPPRAIDHFTWDFPLGGRTEQELAALGSGHDDRSHPRRDRRAPRRQPGRAAGRDRRHQPRDGGPFGKRFGGLGHASHQNGLDVDVLYPRADHLERVAPKAKLIDRALSQDLVDRFVAAGAQLRLRRAQTPGSAARGRSCSGSPTTTTTSTCAGDPVV